MSQESKRILIKFATRGRREQFKQCIKNIEETLSGENTVRIEVTVDHDDETMRAGHDFVFNADVNITYGFSNTKIKAINRDMIEITERYDWDLLVNMSDDMVFVQHGWDKVLTDYMTKLGTTDCFLHVNDGYVGDNLPTMSIFGREWFERTYWIYHPSYASFSCDAEEMYKAQMLGKWHYISHILFRHEHPSNSSVNKRDKTYNEAHIKGEKDASIYFKRMKQYFYINNPKIIPQRLQHEINNL